MTIIRRHLWELAWELALLALASAAMALAAWGASRLGPFFDEPADITAGHVLWRAGEGMPAAGRPPLGPMVEALGPAAAGAGGVHGWPGLHGEDLDRLTAHMLAGNVDVMRMLWWARLPGLVATFLTALLVAWGARALWRSRIAGLLAAGIYCLLPSTLAHAARADGAALSALLVLAAALTGWRWLRGEAKGWLPLGFTLAGLLMDWTLWVLVPFAGAVALVEKIRAVG